MWTVVQSYVDTCTVCSMVTCCIIKTQTCFGSKQIGRGVSSTCVHTYIIYTCGHINACFVLMYVHTCVYTMHPHLHVANNDVGTVHTYTYVCNYTQ